MLYILLFCVMVAFPFGRFILLHLPMVIIGAIPDLYKYIRYKRWNECNAFGRICCYTGLFGQGKTKECVRFITSQYKQYHGRMIYDFNEKKWVQQCIDVYSNVELNIPYIPLKSLQQLVDCQKAPAGHVSLFLIDEASVVFNSREFKSNFSTPALNTILTSRHHKVGVYLTAQRFGHMDALLRQVTSYVYECQYFKMFRIQRVKVFDAWECENCSNLLLLKPLRVEYSYTTDKVYNNYDTYAMVEDISKQCSTDGFYSDSDVLSRQTGTDGDIRVLNNPKRKLKKRF